jgi:hypothetical protein
MDLTDYEFDFVDALEDQALARLRYADSWSDDETEEEEEETVPATSTSISLAVSTSISL